MCVFFLSYIFILIKYGSESDINIKNKSHDREHIFYAHDQLWKKKEKREKRKEVNFLFISDAVLKYEKRG